MLREIRKKLVILQNRRPFAPEVRSYLNDLENREWLSMNFRMSGSVLTPADVDAILEGECILHATVADHMMMQRLAELRNYIYRMADMRSDLSLQMIRDMHGILTGDAGADFRKGNPVLLEYGYNPMIPSDIPEAMKELADFAGKSETGENPFLKAARVHNRIIEIYPYTEESPALARAVMYYMIVRSGCPMAALDLSEQEYNAQIITYLSGGSSGKLAESLTGAVYSRLELMMQLTGYNEPGESQNESKNHK